MRRERPGGYRSRAGRDDVSDDQAILLSDIFPTAYMAADLAGIHPGCTVAVFGCGPVGQLAIASAFHLGAGRVFAVDFIPSRLALARDQGAECVNYEEEDPVEAIRDLTGGSGADRVIDAVGVDANRPHAGPAREKSAKLEKEFERELAQVAPETRPKGDNWKPGDAPSQALLWAVQACAKAGTVSLVGVYPASVQLFPIGMAMNKNLKVHMGNCNHRKYIPGLLELVRSGALDPATILTQEKPLGSALEAFRAFDTRQPSWVKVELQPVH